MADKRFDATLKDLIEDDHLGWATLLNPRCLVGVPRLTQPWETASSHCEYPVPHG
jgi:hypothetical protein